jgi:hypothetical protein
MEVLKYMGIYPTLPRSLAITLNLKNTLLKTKERNIIIYFGSTAFIHIEGNILDTPYIFCYILNKEKTNLNNCTIPFSNWKIKFPIPILV